MNCGSINGNCRNCPGGHLSREQQATQRSQAPRPSQTQQESERPSTTSPPTQAAENPEKERDRAAERSAEGSSAAQTTFAPDKEADQADYEQTAADKALDEFYGDHVHNNPGFHLDGGIADDQLWQQRWKRLVSGNPALYEAPQGRVGRKFVLRLTE